MEIPTDERTTISMTESVICKQPEFKPYPDRGRRWRKITAQIRKRGTVLFDQQMWCWGQDIRACSTNALLQYGFTKYQPPGDPNPKLHNSTSYLLETATGERVVLWGFGLLYQPSLEKPLAVYLGRYDFAPKLVGPALLEPEFLRSWTAVTRPHFTYPTTAEDWQQVGTFLPAALDWVVGYEEWVIQEFGLDYREKCVKSWLRPVMPPPEALAEWRWLGQQARRFGE